ncbi:MAG: 50S ribosomal protein L11 [Candidatus Ryanbacteria bacterium]|nr:50S ribosomal protein L11 [Candidatus Ryanbacteria bacterium]
MAKKIKTVVKIQVTAGQIETAKVGQALGPHGLNLQQVIQQINEATKDKHGDVVPIDVTIYEDRTFSLKAKTPPASYLLKKAAGVEKGSGEAKKTKVGKVTRAQVRQIAEKKLEDLNTDNIEQAMKIIEGTARNMGIEVEK